MTSSHKPERPSFRADAPRILIADLDAGFRDLLRPALAAVLGARTYEARSGEEVYAILDEEDIDLVISNAYLTGTSGLRLLAHLRASGSSLPFIVVTSFVAPQVSVFVNNSDGKVGSTCSIDIDALVTLASTLLGRPQSQRANAIAEQSLHAQ